MGGFGFLLVIIAFAFLYFVLVRPQKRRQLAQQRMLNELKPGLEVVTAGGILGEIREVGDDEVLVRIAPNLDVRVARRAIAGITPEPEPEEPEEPDELEPAGEDETRAGYSGPTPGT